MNKSKLAAIVVFLLIATIPMLNIPPKAEAQEPVNLTPGYYDTSLYMLGNCTVKVIFLESNGAIDPEKENWTSTEINKVKEEIEFALANWTSLSQGMINFIIEYTIVGTSYNPIDLRLTDLYLCFSEVLTTLGYPLVSGTWIEQAYDCVNALRDSYNTDWCFLVFLIDSSNDADGYFEGGGAEQCHPGGPYMIMTLDNGKAYIGLENMDKVMAHETGNIFWASDEGMDNLIYGGYLNSSNTPHGGGVMEGIPNSHWYVSSGTRNQVGWTDDDQDGVPNILDTFLLISINSMNIFKGIVNITGRAEVTTHPNLGKIGSGRDVTVKKIRSVEYRVDNGTWIGASLTPTTVKKMVRYPSTYMDKQTYSIVNYSFSTQPLEPGTHLIELKTVDDWNNEAYYNTTVTVPEVTHDIAFTKLEPYRRTLSNDTSTTVNVTIANQGDTFETFNVTLYYNSTSIENRNVNLDSGKSTTLTFKWNTTSIPLGNYNLKAEATPITGEINVADNFLTVEVKISLTGDINADGTIDILDITTVAVAFGAKFNETDGMYWHDPPCPNCPHAKDVDINDDKEIDILDITRVAVDFGKTA